MTCSKSHHLWTNVIHGKKTGSPWSHAITPHWAHAEKHHWPVIYVMFWYATSKFDRARYIFKKRSKYLTPENSKCPNLLDRSFKSISRQHLSLLSCFMTYFLSWQRFSTASSESSFFLYGVFCKCSGRKCIQHGMVSFGTIDIWCVARYFSLN